MISRIARIGLAAALATVMLAGCGQVISGTAEPAAGGSPASTSGSPRSSSPGGTTTPFDGTKTPPGSTLKIGEPAVVDYKGSKGIGQIKITPTAIDRGSITDLANFKLKEEDRAKTPFYLRLSVEYLGGADLSSESLVSRIDGLDDRGQRQGSVILFGSFDKCESKSTPRGWSTGQVHLVCKTFLLGGGEIVGVRYSEFGTPYRDGPITWNK